MESEPTFKSGFIAVIGKPNVGKSTLMNRLIGAKVSIITDKPQTTRDRVLGILSDADRQIVFVDTPGLIQPRDLFNEYLMQQALDAMEGVDLIYHLIDARDRDPFVPEVVEALERSPARKFLVVNKIDLCGQTQPIDHPESDRYAEVFRISALNGAGIEQLMEKTMRALPNGPPYYDEDILSDRDERFIVAEIVREKVFQKMSQEVPYSVATQVDEFKDRQEEKTYIRVVIYVERDSQKGILIGRNGRVLKSIGAEARVEIEELLGRPVFLDLWVKVRKNWTKKEIELQRFGYKRHSK